MNVLGFDTSTPATVVGLRRGADFVLSRYEDPSEAGRPGHSTRLLPLARELLAQAQVRWSEIQRIAVGVGPGTYTGLRIGLASAHGLALALQVEIVGVSSLRALAMQAHHDQDYGRVLSIIDARRGEVFLAGYEGERELIPPCVLPPDQLTLTVRELHGEAAWLAVGDGAVRFRELLDDELIQIPQDSSELHKMNAAVICELAVSAPATPTGEVLPEYCRRPDAEIKLQSRSQ